ncbi:competence protein ComEA [Pseudomonas sp. CCM 7893]|uniref:Competence protein ComEA n=1 Tax=Pseudomonas spelaei TaxID=1055469 RepID=A0A6I3W604_9PSED|nr:ComEA family DNA-binding protein [Pseudomonas spelaei]MUF06070.1 competence protein ComEA [Pseudomonas spelaei]
MHNTIFSSLFFAFLVGSSAMVGAAPAVTPPVPATVVVPVFSNEQVGNVNLNTADVETLKRDLSGVGAAKAMAIVNYRDNHGPFASVDELLQVNGIGKSLLEKNRNKLSVH